MASKYPLVSVVMPVYNAEKYLAEAIESILNQTYKNFEFIIVDDGSKDKSLEIIKEYAKKDKRIIYFRNKNNLKICKTLNKGIKAARGKYIARMDADDISLPNRFEEQVKFLEKNLKVGVVGSWIEIFNEDNNRNFIRKYPVRDEELRKKIFFYSPFAHPSVIIRKKALKTVNPYNEKYVLAEDLELWFRVGERYEFANIPHTLLRYRDHKESETNKKIRLMEKKCLKIRWKNRRNLTYLFTLTARFYLFFHFVSIYTIPSKLKIKLFNKLRGEQR